jgi:septum formation protein
MKLILASASPRRAEILRNAGFRFSVWPTDTDESRVDCESVTEYVTRIAGLKAVDATARAKARGDSAIVIAADTVVFADGQILGKPKDAEDARRMLRILSGGVHDVVTGFAIMKTSYAAPEISVETTRVHFAGLSDTEIDEYVRTGEPMDKAGSYGIQGIGGRFVTKIEGCYFNVMGLPLSRVWQTLNGLDQAR